MSWALGVPLAYAAGMALFLVIWSRAKRPRRSNYSPVDEAEAILTAHRERRPGS
jgi:hypothetical protein